MLELEMWLFKRLDGSRPRERLYKAVQAARRVFLDDLHDVESLMMSHPNQSNEEPADAS
jgi:hypothetical protein